jgi:hypothetical protein
MTFFLARVQLAYLCREVTDVVPIETSKLIKIPYELIAALDRKFEDYFSRLPFFFRLDAESRKQSKALEVVYPKIGIMRYCILTAAHSRRCRLHQKFLLRQSFNPNYALSRWACLESARAVIRLYEDPRGEEKGHSMAKARMGMAVHFTHLALVVMVMDLCFNGNEADHEERKIEVKAALQMLEHQRHISLLLGRCLDSLYEILQKHKVYLPELETSSHESIIPLQESQNVAFDVPEMETTHFELDFERGNSGLESHFDEFWQIAEQNDTDFDQATWDNIFSVLNSRPF